MIWKSMAILPLVLLVGCSSLTSENYLTRNGVLGAQPMMVVSRPHEFGLEMAGDASGTASVEKFLFFTVSGDKPDVTLPIVGKQSRDPLETLACYRAAQSKGGDAFLAVSSEWERKNFLFLYRKKSVTVKGKSLKITDLGQLSEERADKPINRTSDGAGSVQDVGFFKRLFGVFSL